MKEGRYGRAGKCFILLLDKSLENRMNSLKTLIKQISQDCFKITKSKFKSNIRIMDNIWSNSIMSMIKLTFHSKLQC